MFPNRQSRLYHKFEISDGTVNLSINGGPGCLLRALIVGGGGDGAMCGAGSGYIKHIKTMLDNRSYNVEVSAGDKGQQSVFVMDGIATKASPGQNSYGNNPSGWATNGGNGYSGGECSSVLSNERFE